MLFLVGMVQSFAMMDQFPDIFRFYADHFAKIPMFPVLQCVHLTIMNLKLRLEGGKLHDYL